MKNVNLHKAISFLGIFLYLAVLTSGFTKIGYDGFSSLHDEVANTLLQLRIDTNDFALSGEAFIVEDKFFSYFGVTPSLLRLPFHIFVNDLNLSLIYNILGFVLLIGLLHKLSEHLNSFLYFACVIWVVALSNGTSTYFENILWGLNFSLLSYIFYQKKAFRLCLLFIFLAFHARVTLAIGVSIFFALDLINQHRGDIRRLPLLFLVGLGLVFASVLALNFLKFGHLSPLPSQHIQNRTVPLLADSYVQPAMALRGTFVYLFSFSLSEFLYGFIYFTLEKFMPENGEVLTREKVYGLAFFPLFWIFLKNCALKIRKEYPILVAFIVVFLFLTAFIGTSHRYLFDLYPLIMLSLLRNDNPLLRNDNRGSIFWKTYIVLWAISYVWFAVYQRTDYRMGFGF